MGGGKQTCGGGWGEDFAGEVWGGGWGGRDGAVAEEEWGCFLSLYLFIHSVSYQGEHFIVVVLDGVVGVARGMNTPAAAPPILPASVCFGGCVGVYLPRC